MTAPPQPTEHVTPPADWKAKRQWYADHGILPWNEGGGPDGTLAWTTENQLCPGIDAQAIEALARGVFGHS